jgi:hypothetical protein
MEVMKTKTIQNELTETEWTLIWMAIRYAMNRSTIASATLPEMIIRDYYGKLSKENKESICLDLKGNFDKYGIFGNPTIDNKHWMKFLKCLDTESHTTVSRLGKKIVCFCVDDKFYPLFEYIARPHLEIYLLREDLDK